MRPPPRWPILARSAKDSQMIDLIARAFSGVAGAITALFVRGEPLRFSIFQMMVSLLLIIFLLLAAIYLPAIFRALKERRHPGGQEER